MAPVPAGRLQGGGAGAAVSNGAASFRGRCPIPMEQTLPPVASPPPARGLGLHARLRAAGLHLLLSALVAALAAALVFGLWYPTPFREISGGRELFLIVVAVDVVLGPLITFAVFDRRKPRRELVRDLAVVAALQLAGLAYGLHTVFIVRPVVAALEVDRLRVVRAIDLDGVDLSKAPPEFRRLPLWGVHTLATRQPPADEQVEAIMLGLSGVDLGMQPRYWRPAAEAPATLRQAARPLQRLIERQPGQAAVLRQAAADAGRGVERLGYLPWLARRTDWVALIDLDDGRIVGHANVDGF